MLYRQSLIPRLPPSSSVRQIGSQPPCRLALFRRDGAWFCRTAIAKAPWSSVQDLIKPGPFTQTTTLVLGVFFFLRARLHLVIPAANRCKVHHLNPPFRSLGTAVIPGYCPRYFPQVQTWTWCVNDGFGEYVWLRNWILTCKYHTWIGLLGLVEEYTNNQEKAMTGIYSLCIGYCR